MTSLRDMLARLRAALTRLAERLFGPDDNFEPHEFAAIVDDDELIDRLRRTAPDAELARQSDDELYRMLSAWRREIGAGVPALDDDDDHRWYPEEA